MPAPSAATKCAAGTLRRACRSIARLYDGHLARAGLTTTQFSLLTQLERHGEPVSLSQLAEEQVFERSSLYRALAPLQRDDLVRVTPGRGRAKRVALTTRGVRRIAKARPHWQSAQDAFLDQFGRSAWTTLAAQLGDIIETARTLPSATTA